MCPYYYISVHFICSYLPTFLYVYIIISGVLHLSYPQRIAWTNVNDTHTTHIIIYKLVKAAWRPFRNNTNWNSGVRPNKGQSETDKGRDWERKRDREREGWSAFVVWKCRYLLYTSWYPINAFRWRDTHKRIFESYYYLRGRNIVYFMHGSRGTAHMT